MVNYRKSNKNLFLDFFSSIASNKTITSENGLKFDFDNFIDRLDTVSMYGKCYMIPPYIILFPALINRNFLRNSSLQ